MTKSEMFKKAHNYARYMHETWGHDYQYSFKVALKKLWREIKSVSGNIFKNAKDRLIDLGFTVTKRGDKEVIRLKNGAHKLGLYTEEDLRYGATWQGFDITATRVSEILKDFKNAYYDVKDNKFVGLTVIELNL